MNKPILFNTEMVQAILEGRKTVTRRIAKKRYENTDIELLRDIGTLIERQNDTPAPEKITGEDGVAWYKHTVAVCSECNPPYQTGDVMWVRETFWKGAPDWGTFDWVYKADDKEASGYIWTPSIHMPKTAARIFLRVIDVRAERLQEITHEDALKEGVPECKGYLIEKPCGCTQANFMDLWNSTIKPADLDRYGWGANPWVWVIEFERADKPEDFV